MVSCTFGYLKSFDSSIIISRDDGSRGDSSDKSLPANDVIAESTSAFGLDF